MSASVDPQAWEESKNTIRRLYIIDGHELQGSDGLIALMEKNHGLKATKAQYETKLKEWGFKKKHTKDDWKIVGQKIQKRKKMAKESDVYVDGQLMPMKKVKKEISRQGHMSFIEQYNQASASSPRTPAGFDICTPNAIPVSRHLFRNLPILHFQEVVRPLADTLKDSKSDLCAVEPILGTLSSQKHFTEENSAVMSSLLPISAFQHESSASDITIKQDEVPRPLQVLNIATFLVSNNFPGDTSDEKLYEWFTKSSPTVLRTIMSSKDTTAEALRENLFRLAVQAGDTARVRILIKAGVNPNGHACRHQRIPDTINPFQFACITGNTEMIRVLLQTGSTIDQPGHGWKSSGLVLAILGEYSRPRYYLDSEDSEVKRYHCSDWFYSDNNAPFDMDAHHDNSIHLRVFPVIIEELIEAGAAINPIVDHSNLQHRPLAWFSIFNEGHSPLTIASKYRNQVLVDVLLQKRANVKFTTTHNSSALQECLSSREEREYHFWIPGSGREPFFPGAESVSRAISVAQSLISAGAEVEGYSTLFRTRIMLFCDPVQDHPYWTTLDLSVLTESLEIVQMIISAGSTNATTNALELAVAMDSFDMLRILLKIGAPCSRNALYGILRLRHHQGKDVWSLFNKAPDMHTQYSVLVKAVYSGDYQTLQSLFEFANSNSRELLSFQKPDTLCQALRICCASRFTTTIRVIIDKFLMLNMPISDYLGDILRLAVSNGYHDIIEILLSAGAEETTAAQLMRGIQTKDRTLVLKILGTDPVLNPSNGLCHSGHEVFGDFLIMAIRVGDDFVVQKLLDGGASINAPGKGNGKGNPKGNFPYYSIKECTCILPVTAAIENSNLHLFQKLMASGAAVNNPPGASILTPLAAAVSNPQLGVTNSLLQSGANPYDPLALERATDDLAQLQLLLEAFGNHPIPHDREKVVDAALKKAIQKQGQSIGALLMNIKPNDILLSGVLRAALSHETKLNCPIFGIALQRGADPNTIFKLTEYSGVTHYQTTLYSAILSKRHSKVQILLEAGADPDANLASTCTSPMQLAVHYKLYETVQILLEKEADPNTVALLPWEGSGYPPEHLCLGTPLQIAVERQYTKMTTLLLQYKADTNSIFGKMIHTCLQMACRDGNKELVELLIEHGANVNAPPAKEFGATALQFTAINGLLGIAYILLQYDADVNAAAAEVGGRTALEGAAEHGRIDMVQLLLNSGANVFQGGEEQYARSLRRASENGHQAVRRLLESYHG